MSIPSNVPTASSSAAIPPSGNSSGWVSAYDMQRVQLRAEDVAVAHRDIDQVARQRQHRDRVPDRVERDDHHRVGEDGRAQPRGVHADQQHVDPLGEGGRRLGHGPLVVEHLRERVAEGSPVAVRHHVRDRDEQEDDGDPDDTESARRPGTARVEKRLPDGQEAPDQQQDVDRQQRPEDRRRHHERGKAGEGLRQDQDDADADDHQGRHQEQQREARTPVERLAETRENRREAGRGEAAAVDGSGFGPDSAGVHDGRWSSGREVIDPRPSLPGSGYGDAGRSISLPVTTRRLEY